MTSPVTSTSVATNGAEALAGSNPIRFNRNGSIDPASDPNATIPTSENPTATASRRVSVRMEIIAGSQFISMKRHASERVTWQIRPPSPVRNTNAERSKRSSLS